MQNDKCVYLHKDKEGVVRYVGSGTLKRAYRLHENNHNRGKKYTDFVNTNGRLNVDIIAQGLSKLDAEDLERDLFDKYRDTVLNRNRPSSELSMHENLFNDWFYYDETSPSCLRWKVNAPNLSRKANSVAGYLKKTNGYYHVKLQGKVYLIHRIIAVLHGLKVKGCVIDHINRKRDDNMISNLRSVSPKENSHNRSLAINNKSGVTGVYYHKSHDRYYAGLSYGGVWKSKVFTISKYGSSEEAFLQACKHRQNMVELFYKS